MSGANGGEGQLVLSHMRAHFRGTFPKCVPAEGASQYHCPDQGLILKVSQLDVVGLAQQPECGLEMRS